MSNNIEKSITGALEAVLFAMGSPVEITTIAKALDTDLVTVLDAAEELKKVYDDSNRGITLIELDGRLQLCTKSCYYENLIRIAATPEKPSLTNTLMETLAIVAYKQPVTKAEITKIRGVSSDHAVNRLVEYGLIEEAGRLNAPGRPILFATTEEFLRRFGMSSLEGLPDPEAGKKEEAEEDSVIELFAEEEVQFADGDGGEIFTGDLEEAWADGGSADGGNTDDEASDDGAEAAKDEASIAVFEENLDPGYTITPEEEFPAEDIPRTETPETEDTESETSEPEMPVAEIPETESSPMEHPEKITTDKTPAPSTFSSILSDLAAEDDFTDEELDALIHAGALDDLTIIDDFHDEMVDKIFSEITHKDDENTDDDDV